MVIHLIVCLFGKGFSMKHYFAEDGNYGDGESILIIDTDGWTDEMWEAIDSACDNDRIVIAHRFFHGYSVDEVKEWYYEWH